MKKAILDTSFILSCTKQKIDFFEELRFMGFQVLVPAQVVKELEKLKAQLALRLLRANRPKLIDLKSKSVDKGLIKYSKEHKDAVIATLDAELKRKIKNNKVIIRGKKKLEVV